MGIGGRVSSRNTTGFSSTQTTGSRSDSGLSYTLSTSSILKMYSSSNFPTVAVGTAITGRPPHRSPRAALPHEAPISDEWRQSELWGMDGAHAVGEATDQQDAASLPNSDDASDFDGLTSFARAEPADCGMHAGCRCFPVPHGS